MALCSRVRSAVLEAERKTQEQLTKAARKRASDAGWPIAAVGRLQAHVAGGKVSVTFDGAEDWEYGTESRPPIPVARTLENQAEGAVSQLFDANLSALLKGVL